MHFGYLCQRLSIKVATAFLLRSLWWIKISWGQWLIFLLWVSFSALTSLVWWGKGTWHVQLVSQRTVQSRKLVGAGSLQQQSLRRSWELRWMWFVVVQYVSLFAVFLHLYQSFTSTLSSIRSENVTLGFCQFNLSTYGNNSDCDNSTYM